MKRSWTALAVALVAVFAVAGCNDYGNTFQNNTGATIVSLSPSQISAGGPDFTLTVNGFGFVAKTVVQWNGQTIPTTVSTDSNGNILSVTATVAAALVSKPGRAYVSTLNPSSGQGNNGLSLPVAFTINPAPNPLPAVDPSTSTNPNPNPNTAPAKGASFPLTITGNNFLLTSDASGGSVVQFRINGTLYSSAQTAQNKQSVCSDPFYIVINSISATKIAATISQCVINTQGPATVTVFNPPSPPPPSCTAGCNGGGGGGTSNGLSFTITSPPPPSITGLNPTAGPVGTSVTITGAYFGAPQGTSTITFNGAAATPTIWSATSIVAPVPTGATTGNVVVTVGGVASNGVPFTVTPGTAASTATNAQNILEETPAVTLDGRYVAYTAVQNEHAQIFLRDTCEGAAAGCQPHTALLSVAADGSAANEESHTPSMSSDGRYVAFSSAATNLVENAPPGRQVYLRDTCAGAGESCKPSTQLISADSNGALVGTESILPSVSSSGRFVAFLAITPSHAANKSSAHAKTPDSGNNSGFRQVFIRDTCVGAANCTPKTTRISLQPGDGTGSDSKPAGPALSGGAKHVAIAGGNAAMLFTRSVPIDDRVFLAIASDQH